MFRDAKVGDRVWRPVRRTPKGEWGEIVNIERSSDYPIEVKFKSEMEEIAYTFEGCRYNWMPSITLFWGPIKFPSLPTRPKRKVKKTLVWWANVYKDESVFIHETESQAKRFSSEGRIATVRLTGEYEVEE